MSDLKKAVRKLQVVVATLEEGQRGISERVAALEQIRSQEMTEVRQMIVEAKEALVNRDAALAQEIANERAAWPAKATAAVGASVGVVGGIVLTALVALFRAVHL